MFEILRKSLRTGVVTTGYPDTPAEISRAARGRPEIDWQRWADARPAAAACPTGAISYQDAGERRTARLDLAQCTFCGLRRGRPGHPDDQRMRMRRPPARGSGDRNGLSPETGRMP